jgi:hypothetical protein
MNPRMEAFIQNLYNIRSGLLKADGKRKQLISPVTLELGDENEDDFKFGNNAIKQVQKANVFKIHEKIIDPIDPADNIIEKKW